MVLGFCLTCCSKGFCLKQIFEKFELATGICLTCCTSGFCYQTIAYYLFFLYVLASVAWYYYQSSLKEKGNDLKDHQGAVLDLLQDEFIDLEFDAKSRANSIDNDLQKNKSFRRSELNIILRPEAISSA